MTTLLRTSVLRPTYVARLNQGAPSARGCVFYTSYCDPVFQARDIVSNLKGSFVSGSPAGWGIRKDARNIGGGTCYYNNGVSAASNNQVNWYVGSYSQSPQLGLTVAFRTMVQALPNGAFSVEYVDNNAAFQIQNDNTPNAFYFSTTTVNSGYVSTFRVATDFGVWRTYVGRYLSSSTHSISSFDDRGNLLRTAINGAPPSGTLQFLGPITLTSWTGLHDFFGIWNYCMTDAMVGQMIRERQLLISPVGRRLTTPWSSPSSVSPRVPSGLFRRTVV